MKQNGKTGFSMVELITCIALIAMLTALAVPNFRNAQTSTDVALAKADLQTLTQGLEAYKLDRGAYPWMNSLGSVLWPGFSGIGALPTLERLTTPVAYISNSAPFFDVFESNRLYEGGDLETVRVASEPPEFFFRQYFYHARNLVDTSVWNQHSPQDVDPYWYVLESAGPDRHHHSLWQILNAMPTDTLDNRTTLSKTIYDPTNGAVSRGSIWTVGGSPQGRGTSMAAVINASNSSNVQDWRIYD